MSLEDDDVIKKLEEDVAKEIKEKNDSLQREQDLEEEIARLKQAVRIAEDEMEEGIARVNSAEALVEDLQEDLREETEQAEEQEEKIAGLRRELDAERAKIPR